MAEQAHWGDGWIKLVGDWIDRDIGDLAPLWSDEILKQAIDAAQALHVKWQTAPLPDWNHLYGDLQRQSPTTDRVLIDTGGVEAALAGAAQKLEVNYRYPIQMHGSMGASAAVASVQGQTATVWSSTQGVFQLRAAVATALNLPEQNVRVVYVEGSGCYGLNGADNSALDAAVSMVGLVFGMAQMVVNPPAAAALVPLAIVSLSSKPGSRRWQCRSTKPGAMTIPLTSTSRSPLATAVLRLRSVPLTISRTRPLPTTTSASSSTPCEGSTSRPPMSRIRSVTIAIILRLAGPCRPREGRAAPSARPRRS